MTLNITPGTLCTLSTPHTGLEVEARSNVVNSSVQFKIGDYFHWIHVSEIVRYRVTVADLMEGDVILSGIPARVGQINDHGVEYGYTVEDGNGEVYSTYSQGDAKVWLYNWTDEEWAAYRAL